jgi:hypothetical protein
MSVRQVLLTLLIAVVPAQLASQSATHGAFYVGGGTNDTGSAVVLGTFLQAPRSLVFGLDVAGEGTQLDNTGGKGLRQTRAVSYNTLVGSRIVARSHGAVVVAGVFGVRSASMLCAESYLGFRCFADSPPRIEYVPNAGALVMVRIHRAVVGGRVTSASQQVVLGVAF